MALHGYCQPRSWLNARLEFTASRSNRQLFAGLLAHRGNQLYTTAPKVRTLCSARQKQTAICSDGQFRSDRCGPTNEIALKVAIQALRRARSKYQNEPATGHSLSLEWATYP
jgi:hypothetical protein